MDKPIQKPNNPHFSSGPCSKRPNWNADFLNHAVLGRAHRGKKGKAKLAQVIQLTKELLPIPDDYRVGIVPGSDTGAMEMALWSLLGLKTVDLYSWEVFSNLWLRQVVNQLKIKNNQYTAGYGEFPDLSRYDSDNDCVFAFNGTSAGVRVPHLDWIADNRSGLTICDATSAVFSQDIDFNKLDVTTWSWQKVLGGEAAHGMIALSPRAVERLQNHTPAWPIPKLFSLVKEGELIESIFEGSTINTPSLLCTEDVIDSMQWLKSIGGVKKAQQLSDESLAIVSQWVEKTPNVEFLAKTPEIRSNTSICLKITAPEFVALEDKGKWEKITALSELLEKEQVAYDINGHPMAPPLIRIWAGATVSPEDIRLLLPWLTWAIDKVI